MTEYILDIKKLTITSRRRQAREVLVDGIDFAIPKGKIIGIIGESGSGKSLSMKALMGILPKGLEFEYQSFIMDGQLVTNPKNLSISMIFQDPMTSLNPLRTIGFHLREIVHRFQPDLSKKMQEQVIVDILNKVGIENPEFRLKQFPFEFSGGMRQRIMIAMALLTNSSLLIADEPTTALDVTMQAQLLSLLKELQADLGLTVMIVSHDFSVIAGICDMVYVMRKGVIVETASVDRIFSHPLHPYTQSLLKAAHLELFEEVDTIDSKTSQLIEVDRGHWVRKEIDHD